MQSHHVRFALLMKCETKRDINGIRSVGSKTMLDRSQSRLVTICMYVKCGFRLLAWIGENVLDHLHRLPQSTDPHQGCIHCCRIYSVCEPVEKLWWYLR